MKELNDDMDELFREILDASAINPSSGLWNDLEARLNKQDAETRRKKRLFSLWYAVPVLIFSTGIALLALEHVPPSAPFNNAKQISFAKQAEKSDLNSTGYRLAPAPVQEPSSGLAAASGQASPPKKEEKSNVRLMPFKTKASAPQSEGKPISLKMEAGKSQPGMAAPSTYNPETRADANLSLNPSKEILNEKTADNISRDTTAGENNKIQLVQSPSNIIAKKGDTLPAQYPEPESGRVKQQRFSLQFFYGPEFTNKVFTKDHDSDDNLKMNDDDYKERELIGPSFNVGLKAGYDLSDRWKLYAGISYYSFSQQIQPMTLFTQKGGDGENHFVLNTSAGSAELPNRGTQPGKKDSLMLLNPSSQVLHYLTIPLHIQYSISACRRFSCYAFAGMYFSYLLDSRLVIEATRAAVTDVYTFNSLQGTNKFVLGINAGLGLQYNLSKKISLHAEPGGKFALSPINSNTAVKCYPYSLALTFGLGYHF